MRKVFVLLGFVALASPAWADEAAPPKAMNVVQEQVASPAPYATPQDVEVADEGNLEARTTSGESGDGAQWPCYCASNNGQARCLRGAYCYESPPCQNGNCPPGMACWVESCCGIPVCAPDDCIQAPDCRAPGVCPEFDECSQIPINYCEMVAKKVKRKDCNQCPTLPPQKSGDDCDPPGPNPDKCTPGDKIKGKVKKACPDNPRGACIYKSFQLNGNCAP